MHLVHSGPVVTHRLASGAQPAGQQVCANAGGISAYVKTRITSLRYPMPFPSLTPIWGGKLVLAPRQPDPAAEIVEHKINVLINARRRHDRGGPIGPTHLRNSQHQRDSSRWRSSRSRRQPPDKKETALAGGAEAVGGYIMCVPNGRGTAHHDNPPAQKPFPSTVARAGENVSQEPFLKHQFCFVGPPAQTGDPARSRRS